LEQFGVSVEVEVDNLLGVLCVVASRQIVEHTLDNLGLTAAGQTNKHW